jgi:Uma2 family endonuclease
MTTEILTEALAQPVQPGADEVWPLPLENGDRLTRGEFETRYEAMPEVKKAELIEGVVYMPSPVRLSSHGKPHGKVMSWLGVYCASTPGVDFADNATLRLDPDNEPQPDAMLFIEASGGHSHASDDDYLEGSPELIVEVASSSASYDLHEKFKIYRRNGVQEYVVWRVYDRQIDWFSLQNERYVRLAPDAAGVVESRVFPGLRLNVNALVVGDLARVLADLQQGLASQAHAAFVKKLAAAAEKK